MWKPDNPLRVKSLKLGFSNWPIQSDMFNSHFIAVELERMEGFPLNSGLLRESYLKV